MRTSQYLVSTLASLAAVKAVLACQSGFVESPHRPDRTKASSLTSCPMAKATVSADAPPLKRNPKRKICLMVEPTPFTHVSGYANRFKEMLKFLKKAGDDVEILTVDSKTPVKDLPREFQSFPIRHTQGFTFPLYNHISLTIDLPEMKGAKIIENFKPDIIHVTSPGFLLFAAMFYARVMKIPLVMSYHTHLPSYGTYMAFVSFLFRLPVWFEILYERNQSSAIH